MDYNSPVDSVVVVGVIRNRGRRKTSVRMGSSDIMSSFRKVEEEVGVVCDCFLLCVIVQQVDLCLIVVVLHRWWWIQLVPGSTMGPIL